MILDFYTTPESMPEVPSDYSSLFPFHLSITIYCQLQESREKTDSQNDVSCVDPLDRTLGGPSSAQR